MNWQGFIAGAMTALGLVIGFDHVAHSSHAVGLLGSVLLGAGLSLLGGTIPK